MGACLRPDSSVTLRAPDPVVMGPRGPEQGCFSSVSRALPLLVPEDHTLRTTELIKPLGCSTLSNQEGYCLVVAVIPLESVMEQLLQESLCRMLKEGQELTDQGEVGGGISDGRHGVGLQACEGGQQ